MQNEDFVLINFFLSEAAISEIGNVRSQWNSQARSESGRADVLVIGWATTILDSGERREHVLISFYDRSERQTIQHAIQHIAGPEVVFFVTSADAPRFAGRTVDFDRARGFILTG